MNGNGSISQTTSFLNDRTSQSQMAGPPPMSQPPSRKHSSTSSNRLRHASSSGALQHSRSKRAQFMSDHVAAAIELSSANTNIPPAPAAGMYWSRTVTYGRGPSRPLRAHTANLIGELLYVFGDTLTWSKPRTCGQIPPPCRAHSCTVVEREISPGKRNHYLYVFGGGDGPNYFNDMYVLHAETLTWSKPAIEGTPPSPRRAHTTCLWNDKIIVVGGGDGARALADVHALDVSDPKKLRWTLLNPTGTPPIARGYHTSNLVKDKLVVYGGSDGHECFSDVHVLDLVANRWSHIDLDRAVPRLAHTATQVGSYVFVIGGHDGSRYSSDVLLLNLVTMSWESRKIYGVAPNPRGYHTAVLHDSRLYILGGYDGKNVFDDVYMLELSACAYLPQITNFEIDV
ncbi:hypothetical protein EC973_007089 [Apophysomyces ossiformis]|uniref:Galactose oxidase n=1 Tax=Apophysomyces ossiformis TaxID=679940 RepID=A0A8H7BVN7_9FUNG|nr:hypothetical protein EC973_007089 [Apophysomyces ossiformis]